MIKSLAQFSEWINSQESIDHIFILEYKGKYIVIDGGYSLLAHNYIDENMELSKEQVAIIGKKRNEDRDKIRLNRLSSIHPASDNGSNSVD